MIFTRQNLLTCLKEGESEQVEFKTSFGEEVIAVLTAFSNTKGGTVLIGVADNGAIKGIDIAPESINQWLNEIKSKTVPRIIPDVDVFEVDGKNVVAFYLAEYPLKPVSCRGKYYKRVGNTNHQLSLSEVMDIHLSILNTSWDAYPDANHSLENIATEKVQNAIGQRFVII
jgi:ATP-dependent DNA helicase RecG